MDKKQCSINNISRVTSGFVLAVFLTFPFFSCEKEPGFIEDQSAKLSFSVDTLQFDTIFTTLGSITKSFTIHNKHNKQIRVAEVFLAGGEQSPFRINIDGLNGTRFNNIDILPNDSLYVFVEVTIDPNDINAPVVHGDSVVFMTNNNLQDVNLEAWGQDMHLYKEEIIESEIWTAEKPYLIYNYMAVDSGHTLTIQEGVKVYLHRNSSILVFGTMNITGTLDDPVIIQGDRLEEDYRGYLIPGQWERILFWPGSNGNTIDHAEIRNGNIGIQLGIDTIAEPASITISNTKIFNMSYAGIFAFGSKIRAYNNVIANSGGYLTLCTLGGDYEFYHCSFYNRGVNFYSRNNPSVVATNLWYDSDDSTLLVGNLENALFANSYIYGSEEHEFMIAGDPEMAALNFKVSNCLIRVDQSKINLTEPAHFENVYPYSSKTPLRLENPEEYDFQLDTLSVLQNIGSPVYGKLFPSDLKGDSRITDEAPDLGAYERVE
ncbi:MAG: hypothetical protein ACOCYF_01925 [Bacteroidota bacterium]